MIGLGTLINMAAIAAGGTAGLLIRKAMKDSMQEAVIRMTGVGTVFMSLGGALSRMLTFNPETGLLGTQMVLAMIISLILGAIVGEALNIEGMFERFGQWLKQKSGNEDDNQFISAFLTASLTVCVGAMAIIGAIQDGTTGDYSTLATKAILDLVIIFIMASSLGRGCVFSALPVGIVQGSITLLARLLLPVMTEAVLNHIGLIGNVLIACVGVNLIQPKTFRVANVLPALLFGVLFAYLPSVG